MRYFQVLSFGHLISLDTKLLTSGHSEVLEGHRLPRKLKLHIVWVCAGSDSYLKQIIEFGHKIIHGNIFITHFENHFLRLLLLNNWLSHHCRHSPEKGNEISRSPGRALPLCKARYYAKNGMLGGVEGSPWLNFHSLHSCLLFHHHWGLLLTEVHLGKHIAKPHKYN